MLLQLRCYFLWCVYWTKVMVLQPSNCIFLIFCVICHTHEVLVGRTISDVMWSEVTWCDVIWYDTMWCDLTWRDMMWCDTWKDVMWRDELLEHFYTTAVYQGIAEPCLKIAHWLARFCSTSTTMFKFVNKVCDAPGCFKCTQLF